MFCTCLKKSERNNCRIQPKVSKDFLIKLTWNTWLKSLYIKRNRSQWYELIEVYSPRDFSFVYLMHIKFWRSIHWRLSLLLYSLFFRVQNIAFMCAKGYKRINKRWLLCVNRAHFWKACAAAQHQGTEGVLSYQFTVRARTCNPTNKQKM